MHYAFHTGFHCITWLVINCREKRPVPWSDGRAEKVHVCLAPSGINGQLKFVWRLYYQLRACIKGDVEYDKYFMVLWVRGKSEIVSVICAMPFSVQGQRGQEIVQNFLMVPSWSSLMLSSCGSCVPCLAWKSINEASDLNSMLFPGGGVPIEVGESSAASAGEALQDLALHRTGFSFWWLHYSKFGSFVWL